MSFLRPLRPLHPETGYQAHLHPGDPVLPGNTLLDPDAMSCQTDVWLSPQLFSAFPTHSDIHPFTLLPAGVLTLVPSLLLL